MNALEEKTGHIETMNTKRTPFIATFVHYIYSNVHVSIPSEQSGSFFRLTHYSFHRNMEKNERKSTRVSHNHSNQSYHHFCFIIFAYGINVKSEIDEELFEAATND